MTGVLATPDLLTVPRLRVVARVALSCDAGIRRGLRGVRRGRGAIITAVAVTVLAVRRPITWPAPGGGAARFARARGHVAGADRRITRLAAGLGAVTALAPVAPPVQLLAQHLLAGHRWVVGQVGHRPGAVQMHTVHPGQGGQAGFQGGLLACAEAVPKRHLQHPRGPGRTGHDIAS